MANIYDNEIRLCWKFLIQNINYMQLLHQKNSNIQNLAWARNEVAETVEWIVTPREYWRRWAIFVDEGLGVWVLSALLLSWSILRLWEFKLLKWKHSEGKKTCALGPKTFLKFLLFLLLCTTQRTHANCVLIKYVLPPFSPKSQC